MTSNSSQTKLSTSFLKKNIEFNDVAFDHDLLKIKKEPLFDYQTEKDNMLEIKKEEVDYFAKEIKTEIQSFSVSDLQCDHSNEFSSENSRDEKSEMILEEQSKADSIGGGLNQRAKNEHENVKTYNCICGESLSTKHSLNDHIKTIHEKLKAYQCLRCKSNFSNMAYLKIHVLSIHEKLKPYSCEYCGKRFCDKACVESIRDILAAQDRFKPNKRKIFPKSFVGNQHLEKHIKIAHTISKTFTCSVCKKML